MTLEVIGPGFGRTGTNSLRRALEQLGFGPCHHMYERRTSGAVAEVGSVGAWGCGQLG